jgi:MscS family membrane protein
LPGLPLAPPPFSPPLIPPLPLALHLPLLALAMAMGAWLSSTLLARRCPAGSLVRTLLLRSRLSLAAPLLLGGLLLWLLRLLPTDDLPLPRADALRQLLVVVSLSWTLGRCKGALLRAMDGTAVLQSVELRERGAIVDLLDKLISLLVVLLLGWQLLRLLGVSAGVLLTAGGFGAAALAFGARTVVENGLSGAGLYLNRPFVVGDVIRLPSQQLQGQVEAIGWFTTRLRDPERQTLHIPNGLFTTLAVQNLSQVDHRRVQFDLHLRPQDRGAVAGITAELRELLAADPAIDADLPARVTLTAYSEAGLRLALTCHAASGELAAGLALQQRLLLEAAAVVEHHGAIVVAGWFAAGPPPLTPPDCESG